MRAPDRAAGQRKYEQGIVMQRGQDMSMYHGIQCAGGAASRTVQTGQLVEQTHGIKSVRTGIEKIDENQPATDDERQDSAGEECQRRGAFYSRRNSLGSGGGHGLKTLKFE